MLNRSLPPPPRLRTPPGAAGRGSERCPKLTLFSPMKCGHHQADRSVPGPATPRRPRNVKEELAAFVIALVLRGEGSGAGTRSPRGRYQEHLLSRPRARGLRQDAPKGSGSEVRQGPQGGRRGGGWRRSSPRRPRCAGFGRELGASLGGGATSRRRGVSWAPAL